MVRQHFSGDPAVVLTQYVLAQYFYLNKQRTLSDATEWAVQMQASQVKLEMPEF